MAARVLTRLRFHNRILSKFPQIPANTDHKIRPLSQSPNISSKTIRDFEGDSLFRKQISLASLLQRYGFPPSHLHEFLHKNGFLLDFNHSDVEKCIGILLSLGLSQKSLVSILSSCPRVLELGFLRKWQLGFSKLGFSTVPPLVVQQVLEQSRRLQIEPDDLQCNLEALRNMGLSDGALIRVFKESPLVCMSSLDIERWIELVKGIGIQRDEIDQVCSSFPQFLACGSGDRLRPLFEEFGDLRFSKNEVKSAVVDSPKLILSMEVGELSRCMDLLRNLKCRLPINERILCEGPLNAAVKVKLRVDCLCRHGLIRREALKVIWKEPRLILYELEDIEEKIEFLLQKLEFSISCVVEVPEYLGVNLEKHIIPRYKVIEHLRSEGGLGLEVDLRHLVKLSRLKFYNMFVKPYPECEKIFGGLVRDVVQVKARRQVGLWKLFKPPTYPDTEEDVRNMKMVMDSLI